MWTNTQLAVHVKYHISSLDMPVTHTNGHMPHVHSDSSWTQLPAIGSKYIPGTYFVKLFIISMA